MATSACVHVLAGQRTSQLTRCSIFYHLLALVSLIFNAFFPVHPPTCMITSCLAAAQPIIPFCALAMEITGLRLERVTAGW